MMNVMQRTSHSPSGRTRHAYATTIAALATVPVACAAASGAGAAGSTLLGAGLAGLAGLTLVSERWRRRANGRRAEPFAVDIASVDPTAVVARISVCD